MRIGAMQLFSFDYEDHQLVVMTSFQGEEVLCVDGQPVSQAHPQGVNSVHTFSLPGLGEHLLMHHRDLATGELVYQLWRNAELMAEGCAALPELSHPEAPADAAAVPAKATSWLSLGLIGFKFLKAAQVVKVALMAASVAVYSVMFTVEFALALIAVLVFHEYGHLRAMKKCGLPTKGMYLIPFVGGLAVGDAPKTRWQDVYISMMGPVFGLILTIAFYLVYLITDSHFAGLVASTSALLNLFNLIPVYPLDGGRVVKALVFSGRNVWALVVLLLLSAFCFAMAWHLGLFFITFFIVVGVIDILAGWRVGLSEDIPSLKPYGIAFSVAWYLLVVTLFIGMILLIAADELPGSEVAVKVLSS